MMQMISIDWNHAMRGRTSRKMIHDVRRTRRSEGDVLAPFTLETLAHGTIEVPSGGLVHLQFRRFAGCPVCSLHLRAFAKRIGEIEAARVRTVAFFHSSPETMQPYHADLPFPVVADPERRFYELFGVERSAASMLHLGAMWAGVKGLAFAPSHPLRGEGGRDGLPADFLLDGSGVLRGVRYGRHANDHWEVDEVIARAQALTSVPFTNASALGAPAE